MVHSFLNTQWIIVYFAQRSETYCKLCVLKRQFGKHVLSHSTSGGYNFSEKSEQHVKIQDLWSNTMWMILRLSILIIEFIRELVLANNTIQLDSTTNDINMNNTCSYIVLIYYTYYNGQIRLLLLVQMMLSWWGWW